MKRLLALAYSIVTLAGAPVLAQVPVDDDGNEIGTVYSTDDAGELLSAAELEDLVGPVALYPDDLLAIVLPASTYPLQVVEAARFLEAVRTDSSLTPDDNWDDSVVALVNYPEVVELLNEDLDWTWSLGEAVVAQQADVLDAIESFRARARDAGNLASDEYQVVEENDQGIIEISPVEEDVIHVPYYEPERVVVYQTEPVYHYYARPYPVYYYPYPASYLHVGYFWGVTTAFRIGWISDSLHVWHHSYHGHPYYGRYYYDRWWYRRPSIHVHNAIYLGGDRYSRRHYRYGDYWRPRHDRRVHLRRGDQRITRNRYYGERYRNEVRYDRRDFDDRPRVRNDFRQGPATRRETASRSDPTRQRLDAATQRPRLERNRSDSASAERSRRLQGSIGSERQTQSTQQRPSQVRSARPETAARTNPRNEVRRSADVRQQSAERVERRPQSVQRTPREVRQPVQERRQNTVRTERRPEVSSYRQPRVQAPSRPARPQAPAYRSPGNAQAPQASPRRQSAPSYSAPKRPSSDARPRAKSSGSVRSREARPSERRR